MTSEDNSKAAMDKRQRDFDDLNAEMSGLERGVAIRFFNNPDSERNPRGKAARARNAQMSALDRMLADPAYRALYDQTMGKLRDAELATERALEDARADLMQAEADMDDILDNANRLSDGSRVFRDADGNVRREDGTLVTGPELDEIVWKDGPTYEEYEAQRTRLENTRQRINDLTEYQVTVLGDARDRLEDTDNPPSTSEIEAIQSEIADVMAKAEPSADLQSNDFGSVKQDLSNVDLPDFGA